MKSTFSFNTILASQVMGYSYLLYHGDCFSLGKYQTALNLLFLFSTVLDDKVFKYRKNNHPLTKKNYLNTYICQF